MGAYHAGEAAVQERAGAKVHDWGTAHVGAQIPPIAAKFLRAQRMVAIGTVDDDGATWADVLTGPEGFVDVTGERTITVDAQPALVGGQFTADAERVSAMIALEPWTRRRMRANGRIHRDANRLVLHTDQVYANCPKYIQTRTITPDQANEPASAPRTLSTATELTIGQRDLIGRADTFFIATQAPGLGADVSHRGGNPGFVTVTVAAIGTTRISWPEYVGNSMYMTLGNLELDPRSGLLFIDWETGRTLHLTGRAVTDWDPRRARTVPGAQRLVDFDLDRVVEVDHGMPLRWTFGEYHRFNPPVAVDAAATAVAAEPGNGAAAETRH